MEPKTLIFLAVLALGVVGYLQGYRRDKGRREAVFAMCVQRGWDLTPGDAPVPVDVGGVPFDQGRDRKASNVVRGVHGGYPLIAFDYSFVTSSHDSDGRSHSTTHHYAVVALGVAALLPRVVVTPEGALSRFAQAVGLTSDIELESDEFNRRFRIRADDPKAASDLLPPRTMQLLLDSTAAARVSWRTEGSTILAWETGAQSAESILSAAGVLVGVLQGIPPFVWRDRGYDPGPSSFGGPLS